MNDKDYMRRYYLANKHRYTEYRREHRDERNARRRELYRSSEVRRMDAIAKSKAYRAQNPLQRSASEYGVDVERLEVLRDRGCSICGCGWAPGIDVTLHTDHDHVSGLFRGVLCDSCNLGIGKFYDNPELLIAAASYLQNGVV